MKHKRNYKDNFFCTLFNDEERARELYSALTGIECKDDVKVEFVTLDNVFFGDRENDISFIIGDELIFLVEQQSTLSPNIPIRMLIYIGKQYDKMLYSREQYSKRLVRIPTPKLYVFYNGKEDAPVKEELKLSNAFMKKCDKIALEVVVEFINVNYEKGAELLKKCKSLNAYSQLIYKVRVRNEEIGDLTTAIEQCIKECSEEGILADFLKEHGGEVMSSIFEKLTREECEAVREADGYAFGLEKGEAIGLEKGKSIGVDERSREIALELRKRGMTLGEIEEITGLASEEIEELTEERK